MPLLGRRLPPEFARREIRLAPGVVRRYDPAEWRGALVVVEAGAIELETLAGVRCRFDRGAVLWLCGLPLRSLHNPGSRTAVIVSVARAPF